MSVKHSKSTQHSFDRIKERTNFPTKKKALNNLIRYARRNGKTIFDFRANPEFQKFLLNKQNFRGKSIRVYLGYIWVFNKNSFGLITIYPIPEKFNIK